MSLKDAFPAEIPAQTQAVVEGGAALLGEIDFGAWYGVEGRPGAEMDWKYVLRQELS